MNKNALVKDWIVDDSIDSQIEHCWDTNYWSNEIESKAYFNFYWINSWFEYTHFNLVYYYCFNFYSFFFCYYSFFCLSCFYYSFFEFLNYIAYSNLFKTYSWSFYIEQWPSIMPQLFIIFGYYSLGRVSSFCYYVLYPSLNYSTYWFYGLPCFLFN